MACYVDAFPFVSRDGRVYQAVGRTIDQEPRNTRDGAGLRGPGRATGGDNVGAQMQ